MPGHEDLGHVWGYSQKLVFGQVNVRSCQYEGESKLTTILFICSGNTCRSPMAQALLQRRIHGETGWTGEGYQILSAGIFAGDGHHASPEAVRVMEEEGIDLSAHGSTQFNEDLAGEADIILTMTRNQRDYVRQAYPGKAGCTFTLNEFCGDRSGEVLDPYGLGLSDYRSCLAQIKILVDELLNKIIESRMR